MTSNNLYFCILYNWLYENYLIFIYIIRSSSKFDCKFTILCLKECDQKTTRLFPLSLNQQYNFENSVIFTHILCKIKIFDGINLKR